MSQVRIIPNAKTGEIISKYVSNPEYGYIQLSQSSTSIAGGWIRESKRSTLLRAKTELLEAFVKSTKNLSMPGNIVIKEYLESEVPDAIASQYLNQDVEHEEAIKAFVKRAGADGIELTLGGERILRFSIYDATGEDTDVIVAYDNVEEVKEQNAQIDASKAKF